MKHLSWKPQHKTGGVYCSPACGRRCTLKEHDTAIKKAVKLVKELKEFGWKPHVWENLGWHYCLKKGENKIREYETYCMAFVWFGGKQFVANGKTPKKALKEAIRMAKNLVKGIAEDLEVLAV